jgi:hypothetical protein
MPERTQNAVEFEEPKLLHLKAKSSDIKYVYMKGNRFGS